jgi:hypothetical protein
VIWLPCLGFRGSCRRSCGSATVSGRPANMTEPSTKSASTRVSRIITVPRKAVYQAFLDRDAVASWLPPETMTGRVHTFGPREGGAGRCVGRCDRRALRQCEGNRLCSAARLSGRAKMPPRQAGAGRWSGIAPANAVLQLVWQHNTRAWMPVVALWLHGGVTRRVACWLAASTASSLDGKKHG